MKIQQFRSRWSLRILLAGMMIMPVAADLPSLQDTKWLGFFQGFETKHMRFGITTDGKASFRMISKKGDPVGQKLTVEGSFVIEETMPDGKIVSRSLIPESLESPQPASAKPKGVIIRGKVTGDAAFELTVSEEHGTIQLGGRMTDPGPVKNPLRFVIRLKFPDAYPDVQLAGDKKKEKAFEIRTKDDRVQLTFLDGKRVKSSTTDSVDAGSAEFNGPGIAKAQVQFDCYQDNRFEVEATANSAMRLTNSKPRPLRDGFTLTWTPDPAKDPGGKSRLVLDAK